LNLIRQPLLRLWWRQRFRHEADIRTGPGRAPGYRKIYAGPTLRRGAGFAHGGIIEILLDEAMGKISKLSDERAVTPN